MSQPDILYVTDLAKMLGRTETAIRAAVNRGVSWIPAPFYMGRRIAWRREQVEQFIDDSAKKIGR